MWAVCSLRSPDWPNGQPLPQALGVCHMNFLRILVFVILFFSATSQAFSCSCISDAESVADEIRSNYSDATAVFLGYVYSEIYYGREQKPHPNEAMLLEAGIKASYPRRFVRVRVLDVWKGSLERNEWVDVLTGDGGGDCSWPIQPGGTFILYSYADTGYSIKGCSNGGSIEYTFSHMPLLDRLAKKSVTAQ